MKLLDYSSKDFNGFSLNGRTMIVMAFTPKILVFETSKELNKFYRVWELINDYVGEHEELDDDDYNLEYYSSWFTDVFWEESMFKDDLENGKNKHEVRDIKVTNASHMDNECFGDKYDIKFGTLNSKDMYIAPEDTAYHIKLLDILFNTSELMDMLALDTKNIMSTFYELLKEEYESSQKEQKSYFKVMILGD